MWVILLWRLPEQGCSPYLRCTLGCGRVPKALLGPPPPYTPGRQWLLLSFSSLVNFLSCGGSLQREGSQQRATEGTEPCEAWGQCVAITPDFAEGLPSLAVCPLQVTYPHPPEHPPGACPAQE